MLLCQELANGVNSRRGNPAFSCDVLTGVPPYINDTPSDYLTFVGGCGGADKGMTATSAAGASRKARFFFYI